MPTPSVSGVPLQDGERRQHIITATSHVCLLMANFGVFPALLFGGDVPTGGCYDYVYVSPLKTVINILRYMTLASCATVGQTCMVHNVQICCRIFA